MTTTNNNNALTITYRNDHAFVRFTYDADMIAADFVALGVDPTDDLIAACVDAEGRDFNHDGARWVSEIS